MGSIRFSSYVSEPAAIEALQHSARRRSHENERQAVADTVESDGAASLTEVLGDEQPWNTVKRALAFGTSGPVTDQDHDRFAGKTDPRMVA